MPRRRRALSRGETTHESGNSLLRLVNDIPDISRLGSAWMSGADRRTLSGEPTAHSRKIGFRMAMTAGGA